jgi:hypothetical protein
VAPPVAAPVAMAAGPPAATAVRAQADLMKDAAIAHTAVTVIRAAARAVQCPNSALPSRCPPFQ